MVQKSILVKTSRIKEKRGGLRTYSAVNLHSPMTAQLSGTDTSAMVIYKR